MFRQTCAVIVLLSWTIFSWPCAVRADIGQIEFIGQADSPDSVQDAAVAATSGHLVVACIRDQRLSLRAYDSSTLTLQDEEDVPDSYIQADIVATSRSRFVTAGRTTLHRLQVIVWDVDDDGTIVRRGTADGGLVGDVSIEALTKQAVVTSFRSGHERLMIIVYGVSDTGELSRLARSEHTEIDLPVKTAITGLRLGSGLSPLKRFIVFNATRTEPAVPQAGFLTVHAWTLLAPRDIIRVESRQEAQNPAHIIDGPLAAAPIHTFSLRPSPNREIVDNSVATGVKLTSGDTLRVAEWKLSTDRSSNRPTLGRHVDVGPVRSFAMAGFAANRVVIASVAPSANIPTVAGLLFRGQDIQHVAGSTTNVLNDHVYDVTPIPGTSSTQSFGRLVVAGRRGPVDTLILSLWDWVKAP